MCSMPHYADSETHQRTHAHLVDAVRADLDLPEEEWDRLWKLATPFQRRCARMIIDPTVAPHGVAGTYTNWGCRCDPCKASRRQSDTGRDFSEPPPTSTSKTPALKDMSPLARALHMRDQGFELTEKAKALIEEHEAAAVI